MGDETDTVTIEHFHYILVVPALVPELDDVLEVPGKAREEGV
jgi:hypothetical protein